MSSSEQKVLANQANAQKSTGPKTEEGKKSSSRNSLRHGLFSRAVVLESEDQALFDAAFEHNFEVYVPTELQHWRIIEDITSAQWRLRRLEMYEARILNEAESECGPENAAKILTETRANLDVISRYQRSLYRNIASLQREFDWITKRLATTSQPEKEFAAQQLMAFKEISLNKPDPEKLERSKKLAAELSARYLQQSNSTTSYSQPRQTNETRALADPSTQENSETKPAARNGSVDQGSYVASQSGVETTDDLLADIEDPEVLKRRLELEAWHAENIGRKPISRTVAV